MVYKYLNVPMVLFIQYIEWRYYMPLIIKDIYTNDCLAAKELDIYLKIASTIDKSYNKVITITITKGQTIEQAVSELNKAIADINTMPNVI